MVTPLPPYRAVQTRSLQCLEDCTLLLSCPIQYIVVASCVYPFTSPTLVQIYYNLIEQFEFCVNNLDFIFYAGEDPMCLLPWICAHPVPQSPTARCHLLAIRALKSTLKTHQTLSRQNSCTHVLWMRLHYKLNFMYV